MAVDPDVVELFRPIQEHLAALQTGQDALLRRIETIEATPPVGNELFAARDNLETAIFAAMAGMDDAQQVEYLRALAAYVEAN